MTDKVSVVSTDLNTTIKDFERLKEVAVYLANSEAFVKGFEEKDKDGKVIVDEATGKAKINVVDVTLCLLAGHELNLSLAGSLLYGKKLNSATYMAVMKGRSLGLDVATSLEKVVAIPTKNGTVTYTMVDVISAKLLQSGVKFLPFIKNYAPFYIYYDMLDNELELDKVLDENDDIRPEYELFSFKPYITDAKTSAYDKDAVKKRLEEIKAANKIAITRARHGYYSKAKFVRTFPDGSQQIHYQRFSTLDAERAQLLPTFDSKGNLIDRGKDNWNKATPQMTNNRVISIGGRIILADGLNGIYTKEEVIDAGLLKEDETPDNNTIDTNAEVII